MKKEVTRVEIDLKKIFLTPPNTRREQITLLAMMVVLFVMFFGPICFTEIHPVKAHPTGQSARTVRLLGLDCASAVSVP